MSDQHERSPSPWLPPGLAREPAEEDTSPAPAKEATSPNQAHPDTPRDAWLPPETGQRTRPEASAPQSPPRPAQPPVRTRRRYLLLVGVPVAVLALGAAGVLISGALEDDDVPSRTPVADEEEREGTPREPTLVSTGADGEPLGEPASEVSTSDDGREIAFVTAGDAFGLDAEGDVANVFVVDQRTDDSRLVSEGVDGAGANGPSSDPVVSPGGEAVAFVSEASNLVPDDTNGRPDVFLRRGDDPIERVSVGAGGQQGSGTASQPDLSEDGKVAFVSTSANLIARQDLDGGLEDIFVRDLGEPTTVRLSGDIEFAAAPAISANGRYVTFFSSSDATVPGEDNGMGDVFRRDLETDEIQRITQSNDGAQQNASTHQTRTSDLSADGRYVVFASAASNLVPDEDNGVTDVFVHDAEAGRNTRVSISNDRRGGDGDSLAPTISRSGSFIAFRSAAENLLFDGDRSVGAGDAPRVFLHARQTRTTSLVDVGTGGPSPGDSGDAGATAPATVSRNGNRVIFTAPTAAGDGVTGVFSRLVEPAQTTLEAPESTADPRPVVRLTSDDPAVDRFLCQIDGGVPFACGPGETRLRVLEPGGYRLAARAGGPGMRWDPSAAGASIRVRQSPTGG